MRNDAELQRQKACNEKQRNETVIKQERNVNKRNLFNYKHKKQVVTKINKSNINFANNNVLKYTEEKYIRNISKFLRMSSLSKNRLEAI